MKNFGIIPAYRLPTNRDLLFFDSFISMGAGRGRRSDDQHPTQYGMIHFSNSASDAMEAAYDYLQERNLVREDTSSLDDLLLEARKSQVPTTDIEDGRRTRNAARHSTPQFGHGWIPPVDSGILPHLAQKASENLFEYDSHAKARLFSLLRSNEGTVYTPIAGFEQLANQFPVPRHPVVHIVINALPVPSPQVPYQEVVEFKQEQKVQDHLQLMRRWMRKSMAKEGVGATEMAEELADALHDYTQYMRLARIKYRTEVCQVLLTFPLATIERILKLQFSQLFDPVFTIRKANIALCEAELKAPGREFAYLLAADEQFGAPGP
ncbi:MAG TPA: hypothetical protein VNQ81_02655 [Povalibacter sp.]|nr:hypothetical protein [Povalibacter sp.]